MERTVQLTEAAHEADTPEMNASACGRVVLVGILALSAGPARAAERATTVGGLSVTTWSRDGAQTAPAPVIVFSHGFHGCATQSRFLMEAFADAGYFVVAPNHRDATCGGATGGRRGGGQMGRSDVPFQRPEEWNDSSYRDRADDIRRVIDALRTDERFRTRVDVSRIALAGHSLGGYTVLGLAGAWASWKMSGIKAVLALSPYTQPFDRQRTLPGVTVPVMYQGGTHDFGITPALHKSQGAYDLTPEPKYYVEFEGATHFAWTNLSHVAHDSIAAYSLAFMNHYLKGETASPGLTQARADVAVFRYASELGRGGSPAGSDNRHAGLRARP
jgi:predicted dienelactone hydrolase